jgi:DUF4097 and DUF4098 domain-containing protein YvlB
MLSLAVTLLTTLSGPGHTDTTLAVQTGSRLEISNFQGQVNVTAWNKNAVRIEAEHGRRTHVVFSIEGRSLKIDTSNDRGIPASVDFQLSVPSWMPLDVSGTMTDVSVDGTEGSIKVETVNGDVTVRGGRDYIELSSVQGVVELAGAKGHMKLSSINEGVIVRGVSGQIEAETVNGDVMLDDVQLDGLTVSSVGGDVWFNGPLKPGGRYQLESHSGDLQVVTADAPDANLSVSTYSGEFSSDFDLAMHGEGKRERLQFTLGRGGSQISLESFSGDIQLLKASEVASVRAAIRASTPKVARTPEAAEAPVAPSPPTPPSSKTPKPAKAPKPMKAPKSSQSSEL